MTSGKQGTEKKKFFLLCLIGIRVNSLIKFNVMSNYWLRKNKKKPTHLYTQTNTQLNCWKWGRGFRLAVHKLQGDFLRMILKRWLHIQETVVFFYGMKWIDPASHNSVFFLVVGNVATWNHVQSHGFTHKLDKSYFIQVKRKIKISTLFTGWQ